MQAVQKVEGHPDLVRDVRTKGVVNINRDEYDKFMERRNDRHLLRETARITKDNEQRLSRIEDMFLELKTMIAGK